MRESITPLGAVLIQMGALSDNVLRDALAIQTEIRTGKITKPQGVTNLAKYAKAQA